MVIIFFGRGWEIFWLIDIKFIHHKTHYLTIFACTVQCFEYIHSAVQPSPRCSFRTWITCKVNPWPPGMWFLHLWVCLFWTFRVSGLTYQVAFVTGSSHSVSCFWSSSVLKPGPVPHSLLWMNKIPLDVHRPHLVYPFVRWWTFWLFLFVVCYK